MLKSNYTFDHHDVTFDNIDNEFIVLENVVLTVFKILDEYENLVESSEVSA